jgi:hypothetical protein
LIVEEATVIDSVMLPMMMPDGPSDINVPEIVTADPDMVRVLVPPIMISVGLAEIDWPPIMVVNTSLAAINVEACVKNSVELPMMTPDKPRDITVPEMVIACPDRVSVLVPPITISVGFAEISWPPISTVNTLLSLIDVDFCVK